jgi:hypothetical protein
MTHQICANNLEQGAPLFHKLDMRSCLPSCLWGLLQRNHHDRLHDRCHDHVHGCWVLVLRHDLARLRLQRLVVRLASTPSGLQNLEIEHRVCQLRLVQHVQP